MYICICLYIYTHMHICVYIYVCVSVYSDAHTRVYMCIFKIRLFTRAGLVAVMTRDSWYQVGQEQFTCGALVTRLVTKC